jgi:hypothetical protein
MNWVRKLYGIENGQCYAGALLKSLLLLSLSTFTLAKTKSEALCHLKSGPIWRSEMERTIKGAEQIRKQVS